MRYEESKSEKRDFIENFTSMHEHRKRMSRSRAGATVFFRFSHRDENGEVLSIHDQKEKVNQIIDQIKKNYSELQAKTIMDLFIYGPDCLLQS
jgi:hypothetical protein